MNYAEEHRKWEEIGAEVVRFYAPSPSWPQRETESLAVPPTLPHPLAGGLDSKERPAGAFPYATPQVCPDNRPESIARMCERCDAERVPHERYCAKCKKSLLNELKESGYLQGVPRTQIRTRDQVQATETEPSPAGENAVRILEEG